MRLFNNCFNIDFVNGVWFIMNGHNYYLSSRKVLKVLFSQARNKINEVFINTPRLGISPETTNIAKPE